MALLVLRVLHCEDICTFNNMIKQSSKLNNFHVFAFTLFAFDHLSLLKTFFFPNK